MIDPRLTDLLAIAASQHGAITTAQARAAGASASLLHSWVRTGRLIRISERTLVVPGSPDTELRGAMVAVLDAGPGAVLSHHSAAALWEVPGFHMDPPHVLAPRTSCRRRDRDPTLHLSRRLPDHHHVVLDGIPVVTPTRLPFDLAATLHPGRIERLVDTLWARRLTTGALLHSMLEELARRGRPGTKVMRAVLEERGRGYRPPESNLERRVMTILQQGGISGFEPQRQLGDDTRWLARVDLVHPQLGLVLQVNSSRFHTALLDRAHDQAQNDALRAAGFEVLVLDEDDVWYRPAELLATVRRAMWNRRARIAS